MTTSSNSFSGDLSKSTEAIQCPKCKGEMVQGFIFDRADGGGRRVINWVEGAPHKDFWTVTKVPEEKCIPVGTFRCSVCGFLESYARPEFAVK
jgi:hypothetical protein